MKKNGLPAVAGPANEKKWNWLVQTPLLNTFNEFIRFRCDSGAVLEENICGEKYQKVDDFLFLVVALENTAQNY